MLTRFVRTQLVLFTIAGLVGVTVLAVKYLQVQTFAGIGRINVMLSLPATGGLYRFSNVTYRGYEVGKVTGVELQRDERGRPFVQAALSLSDSVKIPADLQAQVRSVSAAGEQYVDLLPRSDSPPYLHDGSVIAVHETLIPEPIGPVLDNASTLLASIPGDQLHTLISSTANGLDGAEHDLQSLIDSSATIARHLTPVSGQGRTLLHDGAPLLDTQQASRDAIRTWTRALTGVTGQLVDNDPQIRTLLQTGPAFTQEATQLLDQLHLTIPLLLTNLTSVSQLAVTYHPSLEQLLVLLPPSVSQTLSASPNYNPTGLALGSFRLSSSDPPACTAGFLPPNMWRPAYDTTTIDTPDGLYCKLPQDSPIGVRGVRNFPCIAEPGKRAPTAALCHSEKDYEPVASKQPLLGPYPRDPGLEAQGVPPDTRWFPDQGLYNAPGEGPPVPPPPPQPPTPPAPTLLVPPLPQGSGDPGHSDQSPTAAVPVPLPPTGDGSPTAAPSSVEKRFIQPSLQVATYNPRNGEYIGSDGKLYRLPDLTRATAKDWKNLVYPQ